MPNTTNTMTHRTLDELFHSTPEMQIYFKSNDTKPSEQDVEHLNIVAKLLRTNATLNIRLTGYSDVREQEGQNPFLSQQRAESVREALEHRGVNPRRIMIKACGATQAKADPTDYRGRVKDRKVSVEIYPSSF